MHADNAVPLPLRIPRAMGLPAGRAWLQPPDGTSVAALQQHHHKAVEALEQRQLLQDLPQLLREQLLLQLSLHGFLASPQGMMAAAEAEAAAETARAVEGAAEAARIAAQVEAAAAAARAAAAAAQPGSFPQGLRVMLIDSSENPCDSPMDSLRALLYRQALPIVHVLQPAHTANKLITNFPRPSSPCSVTVASSMEAAAAHLAADGGAMIDCVLLEHSLLGGVMESTAFFRQASAKNVPVVLMAGAS